MKRPWRPWARSSAHSKAPETPVGASLLASFSAKIATARETSSLLQVCGVSVKSYPAVQELFGATRNGSRASSLLQVLRGISEIVSRGTPPPLCGSELVSRAFQRKSQQLARQARSCRCCGVSVKSYPAIHELFGENRNSSLLQRRWVRGSQPGMQVKSAVCATSLPWESTSVALTSGPRLDSISW